MIVLDTNVVSAVMALIPVVSVVEWLDRHKTTDLYLSSITIAEIEYGLRILPDGRRRRTLQERFAEFVARGFEQRILDFDSAVARCYGDVMGHRREVGRPMSTPDGQIAAIARTHRMAVATRNVRDFEECGVEILNPFED